MADNKKSEEKKHDNPKPVQAPKPAGPRPDFKKGPAQGPEFKHLVRIANTDLDGRKPILFALQKIKGIGVFYANMICHFAGVDKAKRAGVLSDLEEKKLTDVVLSIDEYDVPQWMLNRRKDYESGKDKHLIMSDLAFTVDNDIKRMKKTKSYKGFRHHWGQPVRGQRTRSNFRRNKGKGSLGVKRSAAAKKGK